MRRLGPLLEFVCVYIADTVVVIVATFNVICPRFYRKVPPRMAFSNFSKFDTKQISETKWQTSLNHDNHVCILVTHKRIPLIFGYVN